MPKIQTLVAVAFLIILASSAASAKNQALRFDGVDDVVTIANGQGDVVNNFTIEAWVKPIKTQQIDAMKNTGTAGSKRQRYLTTPVKGSAWEGKVRKTTHTGAGLAVGTNCISVYEYASSHMPPLLVYPCDVTDWTHIAVVFQDRQPVLYVNGTFAIRGLRSTKLQVHMGLDQIGGHRYGYYAGDVDELRMWSRALSPEEIKSNMNRSLSGAEEGLMFYYDCNKMSSTGYLSDLSGNGHKGALIGGAKLVESSCPVTKNNPLLESRTAVQDIGEKQPANTSTRPLVDSWLVYESSDCSGPTDPKGLPWFAANYDDSKWTPTKLKYKWSGNRTDRFFRYEFDMASVRLADSIKFSSDDGLWLYANGQFIGQWGARCHEEGCVNGTGCAKNKKVLPIPFSSLFSEGRNMVAVHVSNSGGGAFFLAEFKVDGVWSTKVPSSIRYDSESGIVASRDKRNSTSNQNKALAFDGVDDVVTTKAGQSLSLSSFTVEAWVFPRQISGSHQSLIVKGDMRRNYGLYINPGKLSIHYSFLRVTGGWASYNSKKSVLQNQWNHICMTYTGPDKNLLTVYVNGELAGSTPVRNGAPYQQDLPVKIGNSQHGIFKGAMDEVRIWNRALSIEEINQNMKKELTGNENGLVLYYNFNDIGANGLVADLSPNRNNGQISGNASLFESAPDIRMLSKEPPRLRVDVSYQDSDQNGVLGQSETGRIVVTLTNESSVTAAVIEISLQRPMSERSDGVLQFANKGTVYHLVPGAHKVTSFDVTNVESPEANLAKCEVSLRFISNGTQYTLDPVVLIVPTQGGFVMPDRPADLYIENLTFNEPSGNMALDGYESGSIDFTLKNNGLGEAQNINLILSPLLSDKGLNYKKEKIVENIESKSSYSVSIPISAEGSVETMKRSIRIQANEEFGFDADPIVLNFETVAFNPPDLRIDKIAINDREEGDAYGNGNSTIEPNESIVVSAFVQNFGTGIANDVRATVILESSDRNISCPDQGQEIALGDIPPGDYKPVEFYFFTSKRYSQKDIPLKIQVTESRGDYGKTIDLGLKMNTRTDNIIDVNIAKVDIPTPEIKEIEGFTKSDIDEVGTNSKSIRSNSLAVIIGIESYKYTSSASYASRDAGAFYQYATKILGIPDANVYYLVDDGATVGEFSKLFDQNGWLSRRVTESSDIFVFYSGHGAPDIKTQVPYIIPYDVDPNYAQNGYSSYQLYKNLSELNAKSVIVMLDACFSGQNKESEMLFANARPALLAVEPSSVPSNVTLLAASSANQISSGYPSEKHGIFSYFLMKGMSAESDVDKNGKITLGELYDYLYGNVKSTAGRLDREQTPELINGNREQVICEF